MALVFVKYIAFVNTLHVSKKLFNLSTLLVIPPQTLLQHRKVSFGLHFLSSHDEL